jgi:hypothetical protein
MSDIGQVTVSVVPNASDFVSRMRGAILPGMTQLGTQAGDQFGRAMKAQIEKALTGLGTAPSRESGKSSGAAFADEFSKTMDTRVAAALKALPKAQIGASTTEVDQKIKDIRAQLIALSSEDLRIGVSDEDALAKVRDLRLQLLELSKSKDVRISLNTETARAELDELENKIRQVKASEDSAGKSAGGILLPAIVALAPALIPLGAAAVFAGGAFGAMGASGILAFKGIQAEIAKGSALGNTYNSGLSVLKTDLSELEQTAAKGVLVPFQQAVKSIQTSMPSLNSEVKAFSGIAGQIGANTLSGLLGGFKTLEPLFLQLGQGFESLSLKFANFANNGGLQKFAGYAQSVLPQVEQTLTAVAKAILSITSASAPMGTVSLEAVKLVSNAINAIPVSVMQALIPLLAAGYLSFKAYVALTPVLGFLKAYAAAQLVAAGATEAEAAANASAMAGLKGMAKQYGSAAIGIGIASLAVAGVQALGRSLEDLPASGAKALAALQEFQSGSANAFKDMGAPDIKTLKSAIDNTFNRSTLQQIKDFQLFDGNLGPFGSAKINSATNQAGNFFKSLDSGLTQLAQGGQVNAVNSELQDLSAQTGLSIDKLVTKLPDLKKVLDGLAAPAQVVQVNGVIMATTASLGTLADKYHLTATQAQQYASMVGISADAIKNSTVSQAQLAAGVQGLTTQYDNATPALRGYLDALNTYSQSAGTAADKGALIGATLKASQGDALGYAGSMVTVATANQTLVTGFDKAQRATVDWRTGLIDFKNAASAPLIQNLQALQDAATAAASATYQHEVATKGAKTAAQDAATVFKSDTYGALVSEATQLGLTAGQAQALATQYFNMPKSVTTKVIDEGTQDVIKTLDLIGLQLSTLTGKPFKSVLTLDASPAQTALQGFLQSIPNSYSITLKTVTDDSIGAQRIYKQVAPAGATGFSNIPQGVSTVGEQGWEAVVRTGNQVSVYPHSQSRQMLPQGPSVPSFAAGTVGGFTNVLAPSASTASVAAAKKLTTLGTAQGNIRFTLTGDITKVLASALGSVSAVQSAMNTLINAVHSGIAKGVGTSGLVTQLQAENTALSGLAADRAVIGAKLTKDQAKLAADLGSFNAEKSTVSSATTSGFNLATVASGLNSGFSAFGGGTSATPAGIISALTQADAVSGKFAQQLAALRKKGINATLLQQIGEAGVSGGADAANGLAGASKSQIAKINQLFGKSNALGSAAGTAVANGLFGSTINRDNAAVRGDLNRDIAASRQAGDLVKAVARQVADSIRISAYLDGKALDVKIATQIKKDKAALNHLVSH